MPKFQPKTTQQMKAIWGLAKKHDIDEETLRGSAVVVSEGRVDRLSLLSFDEANVLIRNLGGDAITSSRTPRRTVNYRRKVAGVQQIAQRDHLAFMRKSAEALNISEAGLESMGNRMLKHWPPRTTAETNKIIEALKSMAERRLAKKEAA